MKRRIVASSSAVDYQRLKSAQRAMSELLDILDSMNEDTYAEFQSTVGGRIYTEVADGIQSLESVLHKER